MHIEPGIITGAKIALSYATAAGATVYAAKLTWENLRDRGIASLAGRALIATIAVVIFFEVLPHMSVGVSEVHFILGSSLLLMLGTAPAAIGLAAGLLIQALFLSPSDLPQYGANLTTLLVPLFGLHMLSKHVIAKGTAYVDLTYKQALAMSATYQGGIVAWVAFWAFYGAGFGAENVSAVMSFGAAYMLVLLIEPIADLGLLAVAKGKRRFEGSGLVTPRLYAA
jgi:ABC-type Co2+ transport system permease subunit